MSTRRWAYQELMSRDLLDSLPEDRLLEWLECRFDEFLACAAMRRTSGCTVDKRDVWSVEGEAEPTDENPEGRALVSFPQDRPWDMQAWVIKADAEPIG